MNLAAFDALAFGHHVKDPQDEQNALWTGSAPFIEASLLGLVRARARRVNESEAIEMLARDIGSAMAIYDLLGRRRLLLEYDAADAGMSADQREATIFEQRGHHPRPERLPQVPFAEAIAEIKRREPRLAATADDVARLYRDKHAFSIAGLADKTITGKVQAALAAGAGSSEAIVTSAIERLGPFTRGYARTINRTNMTTAYTAGRFEQAKDPAIHRVTPAFFRYEINDPDVRRGRPQDHGENHIAIHGLIADTSDKVWSKAAPPAGYG